MLFVSFEEDSVTNVICRVEKSRPAVSYYWELNGEDISSNSVIRYKYIGEDNGEKVN